MNKKIELGYCMSGYGFLRAYCRKCRDGEVVQIGSSAANNALEKMEYRLVEHMQEKHQITAGCFMGTCTEK